MARKLTRDEAAQVSDFVMEQGKERARMQGNHFNEADYLCGAMAVYFALDSQGLIPAGWIFAPMANKHLLSDSVARADVQHLIDALASVIEALEARGLDSLLAWPNDPRMVRRAREAWERATGERWAYPGRVRRDEIVEDDEEYEEDDEEE